MRNDTPNGEKIFIATKRLLGQGCLVNVVAVHSEGKNFSATLIEKWYELSIGWVKSFDQDPQSFTSFGVSGFREAKKYSFAGADKKLRKRGFESAQSMTISASLPDEPLFKFSRNIEASITCADSENDISSLIWVWGEHERKFEVNDFKVLCRPIKAWGVLDYGFATQVNSKSQPRLTGSLSALDSKEKGG